VRAIIVWGFWGKNYHCYTTNNNNILIYYIKIKYYYIYTTAREKIIVNYYKRFRQLDIIMGDGEGLKTEKLKRLEHIIYYNIIWDI